MPSSSKKQHNFMAAVANNPSFAKKVDVPQSVGKEFSNADRGRKFSKGGDMKHEDVKMDKSMMQKAIGKHAAMPASKAHKGLKAGGVTRADGCVTKGHTKGKQISMKSGGMAC